MASVLFPLGMIVILAFGGSTFFTTTAIRSLRSGQITICRRSATTCEFTRRREPFSYRYYTCLSMIGALWLFGLRLWGIGRTLPVHP